MEDCRDYDTTNKRPPRPPALQSVGHSSWKSAGGYPLGGVRRLSGATPKLSPNSPSKSSAGTPDTSKSHVTRWMEPSETLIVFDWDDTLCPTTAMKIDQRFLRTEEENVIRASLSPLDEQDDHIRKILFDFELNAISLLHVAVRLGKVVIVTLAIEAWYTTTAEMMPTLCQVVKELGIEVLYARKSMPPRKLQAAMEEGLDVRVLLKSKTMARVLKGFYRCPLTATTKSWKNILCIGDSEAEQEAIQELTMLHCQVDTKGRNKDFRTKVVKLQADPSIELLQMQIQLLESWLDRMAMQDGDFSVDFEDLAASDMLTPKTPYTPAPISPPSSHGGRLYK